MGMPQHGHATWQAPPEQQACRHARISPGVEAAPKAAGAAQGEASRVWREQLGGHGAATGMASTGAERKPREALLTRCRRRTKCRLACTKGAGRCGGGTKPACRGCGNQHSQQSQTQSAQRYAVESRASRQCRMSRAIEGLGRPAMPSGPVCCQLPAQPQLTKRGLGGAKGLRCTKCWAAAGCAKRCTHGGKVHACS